MLISLEEARDALRIIGEDNDTIIIPLVEAIPGYLEVTTERRWDADKPTHPLAQTVAKFILQLWFDPQDKDSERLKRTISELLTGLTAIGRSME